MRQRARSREDKQDRRQVILEAARRVWEESTFDKFNMAAVARNAGLAKGTLYLYFSTKEALLLELLESSLRLCFAEIDRRFSEETQPGDAESTAELLCSILLVDPAQTRLLAILGSILEHNIPSANIRRFKRWLLLQLASTGRCLENHLTFFAHGEGLRFLLRMHALVIGVAQIAQPAPAVAKVLAQPGFEPLRVDFETELRAMLSALLRGGGVQASSNRSQSRIGAQQ